jgi:hypothetical protein
LHNPSPSWRVLGRVSRWALLACAGWACLNPHPDTDPLVVGAGSPGDSESLGPNAGRPVEEGAVGAAGTSSSGQAGGGGSGADVSQAGTGGSGNVLPDAGDGGVASGDAGAEVGDAGP